MMAALYVCPSVWLHVCLDENSAHARKIKHFEAQTADSIWNRPFRERPFRSSVAYRSLFYRVGKSSLLQIIIISRISTFHKLTNVEFRSCIYKCTGEQIFIKTPGHSEVEINEKADDLARKRANSNFMALAGGMAQMENANRYQLSSSLQVGF